LLRLGSRSGWPPSRHIRWRRASRPGDHPSLLRARARVVGVPPRFSAVPQEGCREVAVGRSGRHLRRQKRRADLRLCRTDRIRGRLLSEPGLPLGRTRPPRVVRRGTRGHPSRLRTPVIGSPVDDIVVGRPTDLPICAEAPTRPYVGRVGATDRAFCARMAGSFESLPLPDDPTLAAWSAALNAPGYWAYLFDASWRYVFVTPALRVALGG